MSLYKRNGIYWYDFTWQGQRFRKSTGQRDKYLAGLVQNDQIAKCRDLGKQVLLRECAVLKDFAVDFLKWVEDTYSIEKQTKRYYRNGWRLLRETSIASLKMDQITKTECQSLSFPGGPSNANTALRTLRRMFVIAKESKKFFGEIPEIGMRKEAARNRAMTLDEANLIAGKMPDGDAKDAFQILRWTGMRPSECFAMRWELVDWLNSWYANPRGKTPSAVRKVPLLYDSIPILKKRHFSQGSPSQGWVFPAESGSGHLVTIHKQFTKARNAVGLSRDVCLYTARHGLLTDLSSVLDIRSLMYIGGHSDMGTAIKYQHPTLSEIAEKLRHKM